MRPFLAPTPCGCIIDPERLSFEFDLLDLPGYAGAVVFCPWCDSSFAALEYRDWLREGRRVEMQPPEQLVLQHSRVLEVVGACGDCGRAMVREFCGNGRIRVEDAKAFHLEAGPVQVLRN